MIKKISLYVMSLLYLVAGFNHFKNPDVYLKIIPPFLPVPSILNAVSGAIEMGLGMLLIRPESRSLAAWGVILLLIAVFPANIYMYSLGGDTFGLPDWALLLRLPVQVLLIAWAYWHTKNPGLDTEVFETEIFIDATPETVWNELATFANYSQWNPFIVQARGEVRVGEKIDVVLKTGESDEHSFRYTITENEAPRALAWRGSFVFRGLYDGNHFFRIEPHGKGSRLFHGEKFEGILVRILTNLLGHSEADFERMNKALKNRLENR